MVLACPPSIGVSRTRILTCSRVFCRHKSLTAAIERGIGRSESSPERSRDWKPSRNSSGPREAWKQRWDEQSSDFGYRGSRERTEAVSHRSQHRDFGARRGNREAHSRIRDRSATYQDSDRSSRDVSMVRNRYEDSREKQEVSETPRFEDGRLVTTQYDPYRPENLPRTTAASEFLYGYSSVFAAIKAGRRTLYKLYIHERGLNHEGRDALFARARAAKLPMQEVGDDYLPLMDKASSGRPHNGFILEASPLPRPPVVQLASSSVSGGFFNIQLDRQSKEDRLVNGTETRYAYKSAGWRHPFLLYVDGVLDEGNLGAIARSAYFLGVDAIATPTRQSAPWSHIALKASAGAAEAIPIFTVAQPAPFFQQSARAGWRIYASDAIPAEPSDLSTPSLNPERPETASSDIVFTHARTPKRLPADHSPVAAYPTILMMGAEGSGLRPSLLNQAHYKVGIRAGREDEVGVDSLNVSVAASLLCYKFLSKPPKPQQTGALLF